ncbi:hypothetical protein EMPS_03867 [Entomortierella parvispora]|uniref:F-box domain-containing protein n=1 Tax=Entomortierella parvispora TaxID=205924 RepID=A0A9P3H7L2_9FUNG|nr:hypothetical protein EMPS_03867 [Entomortierella parvispora]
MTHPLDIPEIAHQVGSYLNRKTLFACVLVSHPWHQSFLPLLWSDCSGNRTAAHGRPFFSEVEKNRHFIRHLSTSYLETDVALKCYRIDFPRLVRLTVGIRPLSLGPITYTSSRKKSSSLPIINNFIRRHQKTLQSLCIYVEPPGHLEWSKEKPFLELRSIWSLVLSTQAAQGSVNLGQQRLRSLTLRGIEINWDELEACSGLWDILRELDTLTLTNWSVAKTWMPIRVDSFFEPLAHSKIRHLDIQNGDDLSRYENNLISQCCSLQSLTLHSKFNSHTEHLFTNMAEGNPWPYLEDIEIHHSGLSDQEYTTLVERIGRPLRRLTISGSGFQLLSAIALLESGGGRHRASLEVLRLTNAIMLQGAWTQRVLCLLPRLKIFHCCSIIENKDIKADPRDWACNQLQNFRVTPRLTTLRVTSSPNAHPAQMSDPAANYSLMFKRLAGLTHLHTLQVGVMCCDKLKVPHATTLASHFENDGIMLKWTEEPKGLDWEDRCDWECGDLQ